MFRRLPYGAVEPLYPCCRDSNDRATFRTAVTQRIGTDLPDPDPELLTKLEAFVGRWLVQNLPHLAPDQIFDFDQWIDQAPYPQERKAELRAIYAELHGQLPTKKQSSRVNCFMKTEFYVVAKAVLKYGRLIMSRSDFAKVTMGPAMASIERLVYDIQDRKSVV